MTHLSIHLWKLWWAESRKIPFTSNSTSFLFAVVFLSGFFTPCTRLNSTKEEKSPPSTYTYPRFTFFERDLGGANTSRRRAALALRKHNISHIKVNSLGAFDKTETRSKTPIFAIFHSITLIYYTCYKERDGDAAGSWARDLHRSFVSKNDA